MFREEERKNRRTYLSSKGADSSDPKLLLAEDFRSEAGFGGGVQLRSWLWRRSTLPKLVLGGRKKMTDLEVEVRQPTTMEEEMNLARIRTKKNSEQ